VGIHPSSRTESRIESFLNALVEWAAAESDILAVAVVGSYARGAARAGSDVDIVLIVMDPGKYFLSADWTRRFGDVRSFRDENWGRLRSRRVYYASEPEVEFGFTAAAWASTDPVDRGTRKVVADGLQCIYDPTGMLHALMTVMQSEPD
jgi:predicted nucleotidyltransferase